jgi:SAM-dependent methyltransferase
VYKPRKMRPEDVKWYDEHYRKEQTEFAPWYRWLVPHLRRMLRPDSTIIELGCGQGQLLRHLAKENLVAADRIYGIEQSPLAVEFVNRWLPGAHVSVGDIYKLDFSDGQFDVCFLMETIEHLERPDVALREIQRVLRPGGLLYVSFPNFLHLPWLAVRLLSDLLNKPNWIVRQPIDRILTVFHVRRIVGRTGFAFVEAIGSNYGPPVFYRLEKDWMTRGLNQLRLWWISFHPILVFKKPA